VPYGAANAQAQTQAPAGQSGEEVRDKGLKC